jgi:hypothetical protein
VKFTLIHWRNYLEELVPKKEKSTSLEDRPDLAAGKAPTSKRRSRQRWWRERGSGVEELPKWVVHPDALYLYGQTAGPDYPSQTWTGYSSPGIIRPKSGPDNSAWNSFAREICGRKTGLVCMERIFLEKRWAYVRKQTRSGSRHLELQKRKKPSKDQLKCLPISRDKQNQEKTQTKLKRFSRNKLFKKKRSVAEATIYECFGIGPRRYILGP